jgi:hypothetical protein
MLKVTAFWDFAPCSLVQTTDVSEVLTASVIRVSHGPDNGCIKHILNYGLILQDYMAQKAEANLYTRRRENLKPHLFL